MYRVCSQFICKLQFIAIADEPIFCRDRFLYKFSMSGKKHFTLAGGFQRGTNFTVRDSARYVSKAQGRGGSALRVEDPGPKDQLTAIDGFEITGYAQAIVRDVYYSQRFDVTNNHGNKCADDLAGPGVVLNNVSGRVQGNVFRNNSCGRGGALFVQDAERKNTVLVVNNLVDNNPVDTIAVPSLSIPESPVALGAAK